MTSQVWLCFLPRVGLSSCISAGQTSLENFWIAARQKVSGKSPSSLGRFGRSVTSECSTMKPRRQTFYLNKFGMSSATGAWRGLNVWRRYLPQSSCVVVHCWSHSCFGSLFFFLLFLLSSSGSCFMVYVISCCCCATFCLIELRVLEKKSMENN